MRTLLLAAASMLAVAAPAYAQDDPAPFDGFYVGGTVGYSSRSNDAGETVLFDRDLNGSFGDTVVTTTGQNAFAVNATPGGANGGFCNGRANTNNLNGGCTSDRGGIEYSVRAGYDRQFGNIVVGLVGEFGRSEVRDSVTAFSTTPASYVFTRELDWNAALRLRAGYAANTTLFYATGGATYGRIDNSFATTNTANSFTGRGDDMSWGWQAGGGVEQKIGRNFSIGLEYLYTRFTQDDYVVRAGAGTAPATNPFLLACAGGTDFIRSNDHFDYHGFRFTAAFRF